MSAQSVLTLSFPEPDLALLAFNDPAHGANVLSRAVLAELSAQLDQLAMRDDLRGLIVTSTKPGSFLAGADIKELAASFDKPRNEVEEYCRQGRRLYQRLGQFPFPTVVAIEGLTLGGGLELGVWADFRIAADTPRTEFGFPEVKLGLIPGWGGIWTATKLAGLGNIIELICGGENITAEKARSLGLIDEIVPHGQLLARTVAFLRDPQIQDRLSERRAKLVAPSPMSEMDTEFLEMTARGFIERRTGGHYPAPLKALDVLVAGSRMSLDDANDLAAREMAALVGGSVNRALTGLFFAREKNKKDPGIDTQNMPSIKPINTVGIVGAGIMGYSIAAVNIKRGVKIVLGDANEKTLSIGTRKAIDEAAYDKTRRGPDPARAEKLVQAITTAKLNADFAACDLTIEAIVEKLDVKRQVLGELEAVLPADAFLASNTSTIRIGELAAGLARPQNFCGLHFFNPVRKMPLVEVIRGPQTGDEIVAATVAYAKRIGKTPIVVHDGPGFLVNRLLSPYLNEAMVLLHEGVHWSEIDAAAVAWGMPLGPFAIYDMVGTDTSLYAGRTMWEAFPERMVLSSVLVKLLEAGRLGQKSGAGFYLYKPGDDRPLPDATADEIVAPGDRVGKKKLRGIERPAAEDLIWRLLLPMVLEATLVLQESVVRQVQDIDLGMVLGLGFPPFRGGILRWADQVGAAEISERVRRYEKHGPRWRATPLLEKMAREGTKFYGS